MLLHIHPAFQALVTIASFYILYLGFQRFRFLHLKQKASFNWKRHTRFGQVILVGWLLGMIGGLVIARIYWRGFFVTGIHAYIGLSMIPFILFGLLSGIYMDRLKKKRTTLPLIHGLNNLLVVIMTLVQMYTGYNALQMFVFGL